MSKALSFVLALILSTSGWSTVRAATVPKPQTIEVLAKAILELSSKDAAAAHASSVYKAAPQPEPSSWKDKLHSAAGVAKDFGAIFSVGTSTGGTLCFVLMPPCREYYLGSNSGKKPEDAHRQ